MANPSDIVVSISQPILIASVALAVYGWIVEQVQGVPRAFND